MAFVDANGRRTMRLTAPPRPPAESPTPRPASLTQNFFLKGEEQEANGYENVVLEEPVSAPDLKFDSFDKIPRRRRPLIALAVFFSFFALGAVAWKTGRAFSKQGSVKLAAQAMVTAQPAQPTASASASSAATTSPATTSAATTSAATTSAATTTTATPPPVAPAAALTIDQGAAEEPAAAKPAVDDRAARGEADNDSPVAAPIAQSPSADSPPAAPHPSAAKPSTGASRRARRPAPLHGYVWSPEAHTLVPASRTSANPFADPEPSVAPPPAPARVLEDTPERSVEPAQIPPPLLLSKRPRPRPPRALQSSSSPALSPVRGGRASSGTAGCPRGRSRGCG